MKYRFRVEIGETDATGVVVWSREYFIETVAGNSVAAREQISDLVMAGAVHNSIRLLDIALASEHRE